jgi:hypothetical protein
MDHSGNRAAQPAAIGLAIVVMALVLGACGGSASTSATGSGSQTASPTSGIGPSPSSAMPLTTPSPAARCGPQSAGSHQAPELEAILPEEVAGRQLARWSLAGRCWLEMTLSDEAALQGLLASVGTIDFDRLRFAVAGRTDTQADPPYFVFAAARPHEANEADLATLFLLGGAGFVDPVGAMSLDGYAERTLGGKDVSVGQSDLLDEDEHQRGRPFLYQTDDWMFVVVTDDEAWAADALAQLP